MACDGSPPIWRSTERSTTVPMAPSRNSITAPKARSLIKVSRTWVSRSSVYRPEPTIQSQPSTFLTYCSLGSGSVWPGRGKRVITKAVPSWLARIASISWVTMSMPSPSLSLPAMTLPSHSGLNGCITAAPSVLQM